jgi:hypothetical protein
MLPTAAERAVGTELDAARRRDFAYCPHCRRQSPRNEWRQMWRHIGNGTAGGSPAEVLRHKPCGDIIYVVLQGNMGDFS